MTRYLRRRRPDRQDTLKAVALGVGIGLAAAATTFYLGRLFLTREILGNAGGRDDESAGDSSAREGRSPRRGGSAGS